MLSFGRRCRRDREIAALAAAEGAHLGVKRAFEDKAAELFLTSGEVGIASAQTVIVALLPVLLAQYTHSALLVGFAIGGEGFFALAVPFWAGKLSDRLHPRWAARFGRRTFFLFLTAPIMAAAIALAPFLDGFWTLTAVAFVFFAALQAYTTPFMALLVDDVPDERRGAVQGIQGAFRAAGLGYGLVAAGLLFSVWRPLPFLTGGAMVLATTMLTARADRRLSGWAAHPHQAHEHAGSGWTELLRKPAALWLLLANSLWSAAIDGVRPYVFLYASEVLGANVASASFGMLFLVAGLAIGSLAAGRLGDRFPRTRVLSIGTAVMSVAMLAGFFARDVPVAIGVMVFASAGAATMMTLPYPAFASIMGERTAGEYTGLFVVGIGLGRILSPMLVGGAVDWGARWLPEQKGYPFMWLVAGGLASLGWLALRKSEREARHASSSASSPAGRTVRGQSA
jgi:MFS family permease